ncbi:MAG: hypothetical protein RMJ98_15765 [Myxococcales bacterium]|nr:hypothetical protein [Polyangiaceae bacterium]MDW8250753.1 hypothetical protein [Myxococcales bacterium]
MAWIVPRKNRNTLLIPRATASYREHPPEPQEIGPVPVPLGAPFSLDASRDLLAYGQGGRLFFLWGVLGGKHEIRSLRVSWVSTITAVLIHGSVVYVGGIAPFGALLGLVFLGEKLTWKPLELPRELIGTTGKKVDGFVLHNDRLIVVDDRVFPWYFLLYDVTSPEAPRPLGVRMFHGPISSVASGHGFLALRQILASRAGLRRSVRLHDLDTLDEHTSLEGHEGAPEWGDAEGIPGLAFTEGSLLMAQGERGLSELDLTAWKRGSSFQARLVDRPVAEGPVVGVISADAGRAFAVVRSRAGLDSVLVG